MKLAGISRRVRPIFAVAARESAKILLALVIGGFAGGALARYAAGFGVDERELDSHLSRDSQERIRSEKSAGSHYATYYFGYLKGVIHGDFGFSSTLNRPVAELLRQRLPVTGRELAVGMSVAASLAVGGSLLISLAGPFVRSFIDCSAALLLCAPLAVAGYATVFFRVNPAWAMAACLFPYLWRYAGNILKAAREQSFVSSARSRGLSPMRVQFCYVLLPSVPELFSTLVLATSVGFGAAIPIEFASGAPGAGQLAWEAASSRDLPLLCALTMFAALLVLGGNAAGEIARTAFDSATREGT